MSDISVSWGRKCQIMLRCYPILKGMPLKSERMGLVSLTTSASFQDLPLLNCIFYALQ